MEELQDACERKYSKVFASIDNGIKNNQNTMLNLEW